MLSRSLRYRVIVLISILLLILSVSNPVFAQSRADQSRQAIEATWSYFDPFDKLGTCSPQSADENLVGQNNAEKIYNFLTGKGLSPAQAAGIMGNLKQESQYEPTANEKGTSGPNGIGGYGIAQWTGPRRVDLFTKLGNNVDSLSAQLNFLYEESKSRQPIYPGFVVMSGNDEFEGLKMIEGVEESVIYWEKNFERAGIPVLGQRLAYANEALARYGGSSGGASSYTTDCTDNGTVVGKFSLPSDKIFFEEHREWFTKPHHSGQQSADIPLPSGAKIYSITSGKIVKAPITSDNTSYGNGVWIDAGNNVEIIYGHGLDGGEINGAKVGDTVKPGQLIMHNGSTGNSTGPHLHLEIRVNGVRVCPQNLLVAIGDNKTIPDIKDLPKQGCTY